MSPWLTALAFPLLAIGSLASARSEPWARCLYNNQSIDCRRTFHCNRAPCGVFSLEWTDGARDVFTRYGDGVVRNVCFYRDTRGGEWMLRGFAGSFGLSNAANGNAMVYDMTIAGCRQSMLADLCCR